MSNESRKFGSQVLTLKDIAALSIQAIVTLYNNRADKPVSRFSDRKAAERRLWALGTPVETAEAAKPEKAPRAPKTASGEPRKGRSKTFRLAPRDTQKVPKEGSKRRAAFDLIGRDEGAKLTEIMKKTGWDEDTAYEGVRHLNVTCGFGLYHHPVGASDHRIFLAKNNKEFRELSAKYKDVIE